MSISAEMTSNTIKQLDKLLAITTSISIKMKEGLKMGLLEKNVRKGMASISLDTFRGVVSSKTKGEMN